MSMQQLDKVTQQNAAASEELASVSEEMNAQAQELQTLISFFSLSDTTDGEVNAVQHNGKEVARTHARDAIPAVKTPLRQDIKPSQTRPDDAKFERF